MSHTPQNIAWDGTAVDFWRAVEAIRQGRDIESDHAVLCEVLMIAQTALGLGPVLPRDHEE